MSQQVRDTIQNTLSDAWNIQDPQLVWGTPPKQSMGDISIGVFPLAKSLKKSPTEIAVDLRNLLESQTIDDIQHIETVWGYVNVFLNETWYTQDISEFLQQDTLYPVYTWGDIIIDYIGANVWKPLHIGHMCTPLQGQVFKNLYEKLWVTAIGDSHIGDWWIIFWKLIVAYKKYGDDAQFKENPVEHLFDLYVKISAEAEDDQELEQSFRDAFQALSRWDASMIELWETFTRASIESMQTQLSRIFVQPDYNIWESFYEWLNLPKLEDYPDVQYPMSQIVQELVEKGIATKNEDGSIGVTFPESTNLPSTILQKRDGTHGYLASDLATIKYRVTHWDVDTIVYFVDVRQQLHLQQTFAIAEMSWWLEREEKEPTQLVHASNGFISLKDGTMSTRTGKIIPLKDLLDEAEDRAETIIREKRPDIAPEDIAQLKKDIWIGAVQYGYLKKSRESDSIFDWDEFMSFEWNSGPYIQYAYVRAVNILEKSNTDISYENLVFSHPTEKNLAQLLLKFPSIIEETRKNFAAHILANYLYELTQAFSRMYAEIPMLHEENEQYKNSRLALVEWFHRVIQEGFWVLGIPLLQKM